jgi:hypothetical protein
MKDRRKIVTARHVNDAMTPGATSSHHATVAMLRKPSNETALIF